MRDAFSAGRKGVHFPKQEAQIFRLCFSRDKSPCAIL
jgi:hypothetical protein